MQSPFAASLDATSPRMPPTPWCPHPRGPTGCPQRAGNYGPAAPLQEEPHPGLTLSSWPRRSWGQQPGPRGGRSTPSALLTGRSWQQVTAPGSLRGWPSPRADGHVGPVLDQSARSKTPGPGLLLPTPGGTWWRGELSPPVPSRPVPLRRSPALARLPRTLLAPSRPGPQPPSPPPPPPPSEEGHAGGAGTGRSRFAGRRRGKYQLGAAGANTTWPGGL